MHVQTQVHREVDEGPGIQEKMFQILSECKQSFCGFLFFLNVSFRSLQYMEFLPVSREANIGEEYSTQCKVCM